jgi:hypothetical protein
MLQKDACLLACLLDLIPVMRFFYTRSFLGRHMEQFAGGRLFQDACHPVGSDSCHETLLQKKLF